MFLVEHQSGGTWHEPEYTGTGFPGYGVGQTIKLTDPSLSKRLMQGPELSRAFMLRYDMYRHYFPLMALGRALRPQAHGRTVAAVKAAGAGSADSRETESGGSVSRGGQQGPELSRA
jgi:squalene-hopene/tetraprenyl-beta-curcumene cyclase